MVLINETSIFTQVFLSFSTEVFGSNVFTALMLFLLFFIIGMLIKIPLAINLSLFIPISIILMAIGFLPVIAGTSLVIILMVLTGISLVNAF